MVFGEMDEMHAGVLFSNACNYLRGSIARAIIDDYNLVLAETFKLGDRGESASDIGCFIIRDYDEADVGLPRHNVVLQTTVAPSTYRRSSLHMSQLGRVSIVHGLNITAIITRV